MRTTISIPPDLFTEARVLAGERPFSEFAREALQSYVDLLRRKKLANEMAQGYQLEAEDPSLDPAWTS